MNNEPAGVTSPAFVVMPALGAGIHDLPLREPKSWMAGPDIQENERPGHDDHEGMTKRVAGMTRKNGEDDQTELGRVEAVARPHPSIAASTR
jgi:hypothetical protein